MSRTDYPGHRLLRDADHFESRISKLEGGSETATYIHDVAVKKPIDKPAPPPSTASPPPQPPSKTSTPPPVVTPATITDETARPLRPVTNGAEDRVASTSAEEASHGSAADTALKTDKEGAPAPSSGSGDKEAVPPAPPNKD